MHAAADGDFGPLVGGLVVLVIGVVATFTLFGLMRRIAQAVAARYANGSAEVEALAFATYRVAGVLGLLIAGYLLIFL